MTATTTRARTCRASLLGTALAMMWAAGPLAAQTTVFEEDFENLGPTPPGVDAPPELVSQGWIFRFQDGSSDAQWRRGTPASGDTGYSGWYYLQIYDLPNLGQPAAAWAILPDIPDLTAGQQFRMLQFTWTGMALDHWELRWSPTGGTDTGNNWDDVGDFTVSIPLEITNQPLFDFDIASASLPGSGGRLAVRYVYDTWFGGSTPRAGVDLIQIFGSPAPPVPGPGETVHWTADISPITVTDQIEVPETATLVIDAGVEVVFSSSSAVIQVHGTLQTEGTPTQPVRFTPGNGRTEEDGAVALGNFAFSPIPAPLPAAVGIFEGLESRMRIGVGRGAVAVFRDCTFVASGSQPTDPRPGIEAMRASVFLSNTSLTHGWCLLNDCFSRIEDCTFDDTQLELYNQFAGNPVAISQSTFRNVADDAPVLINGVNAWFSSDNLIENNLYPLRISSNGGGILPGSTLPPTGNTHNWIEVSGFELGQSPGHVWRWADVGLPYVWGAPTGPGGLDSVAFVDPGVVMEVRSGKTIGIISLRLRGRPEAPIVMRRHDPGQSWLGAIAFGGADHQIRHCRIEGAVTGLLVSGGGVAEVLDCAFENNGTGLATGGSTGPRLSVHKTLVRNNTVGIEVSANSIAGALLDADDPANPNAIENNGAGLIDTQQFGSVPPQAAHNWWGDPSGPQHPSNPGGSGDSADPVAQVLPFETIRPDFADHPPVVDVMALGGPMRTGERFILRWQATDDGAIVSQRVLYGPSAHFAPFQTVAELDGAARSVELTMPAADPGSTGPAIWRVVAVDDAGQEGWDDKSLPPVDPNSVSDLAITTDLSGGVQPGAIFDLHWSGVPSGEMQIQLTGQRQFVRLGGVVGGELPSGQNTIPGASTDMARYVLSGLFNGRPRSFYGPFFTIRPPADFADAPPTVTLTSPQPGESFTGGTVIPIRWSAGDDVGLKSFDIQASYNGGLAWHDIARDLPATARSFDLDLPASEGIDDVRLRVIARDTALQLTSAGGDVPVTILPGAGLPGDIDGDGDVDLIDLSLLLNAFGTCDGDAGFEPAADFDGSGCVDLVDLSTLLGSFGA